MICPNCEKEISFWDYMISRRFFMKCNQCNTKIKPEKQGLYILTYCIFILVTIIFGRLSSIFDGNNHSWIYDLAISLILVLIFIVLSWYIWKYWKIKPKK
jgi:hypothetical protein